MDARSSFLAATVAAAVVGLPSAWAGGWAGHGAVFRQGTAFHGGGFHAGGGSPAGGGFRGAPRGFAGMRGLPPVSGVIHERTGVRPYFTAYGHTNTAAPRAAFGRPFGGIAGRVGMALPAGGYGRPYGSAYGHVGTVFRPGVSGGRGFAGRGGFRGGLRFDEARRRFGAGRLVYGGGFGGYGGGFGGYGSGEAGGYGGGGTYGGQGTYGTQGSYGTYGTQTGSGDAGAGQGFSYASETPLASRFAEPPLAPSPYGADDDANGYAYAASEDVGSGPRIITVRHGRSGCGCASRAHAAPVVYRYGVGTAY